MKKLIFILLFFISIIPSSGQKKIQMEPSGGVYKIPCTVNGAKMKMIFDTGAAKVSISKTMAEYLYENEYISQSDFKGTSQSVIADGSIVDNLIINIKDLEIDGIHLSNIEAWVSSELKAPLLFGQSAIKKLGPIEISGNVLIIKNSSDNLSDEEIDSLFDLANKYIKDGLHNKAKEVYSQLYGFDVLSDYGKYNYAWECYKTKDYQMAKSLLDEIHDYDFFKEKQINIYFLLGRAYEYNDCKEEAIAYYKLAFDFPGTDLESQSSYAADIAYLQKEKGYYLDAKKHYQLALFCLEMLNNLEQGYLVDECLGKHKRNKKSYRDDNIDYLVYQYFNASFDAGEISTESSLYYTAKLAQNGNRYAKKFLNDARLDWTRILDNY